MPINEEEAHRSILLIKLKDETSLPYFRVLGMGLANNEYILDFERTHLVVV